MGNGIPIGEVFRQIGAKSASIESKRKNSASDALEVFRQTMKNAFSDLIDQSIDVLKKKLELPRNQDQPVAGYASDEEEKRQSNQQRDDDVYVSTLEKIDKSCNELENYLNDDDSTRMLNPIRKHLSSTHCAKS